MPTDAERQQRYDDQPDDAAYDTGNYRNVAVMMLRPFYECLTSHIWKKNSMLTSVVA